MDTPVDFPDILLDTDVFSFLLMKPNDTRRKIYAPHVERRRICVSFVTVGELFYWSFKRKWGAQKLEDLKSRLRSVVIVPYDSQLCFTYADVKAKLEAKGIKRADNDLWIAACAIRHSIPLLSHNRKHFDQTPGLVLISEAEVVATIESQGKLKLETTTSAPSSEQEPPPSQ